jgi:recombination associated protein RdgC
MGLLSHTVSITRYKVQGRLKEPVLETVASCLKKHAIREIDEDISDKTVGWTSFDRPYAPEFSGSSFNIGTYFVFSLRIDKRTIPPAMLKKHCAIEMAKRLARIGRPYLSSHEKDMIRDDVSGILRRRIPATPHVYDLLWSYEEAFLWFFATLKSANEDLETLFLKSFEIPLIRLFPYTTADLVTGLSDQERDALLTLSATSFTE